MASRTPLPMPPREELVRQYEQEGLGFKKLGEIHHVSIATISKWFHAYEIPTTHRMPKKVFLKEINGVKHRRCYGPHHTGSWVPISKFRPHKGKPFGIESRCRRCDNPDGQVDFTPTYKGWLTSIYRRIGFMETCRRLEISEKTLRIWRNNPPRQIRKKHAESIVHVLSQLRATGEVRHRKSVRRGAAARGEIERKVSRTSDLLHRAGGDADTDYKREYRRRST